MFKSNNSYSLCFFLYFSANPHAHDFRHKVGRTDVEKCIPKFISLLKTSSDGQHKFYSPPIYYFYERKIESHTKNKNFLIRGDCNGHLALWNLNNTFTESN
jgi:hypothetical protein